VQSFSPCHVSAGGIGTPWDQNIMGKLMDKYRKHHVKHHEKKTPRKPMDKNNNTLIVNELFDRCDSPNCFFLDPNG